MAAVARRPDCVAFGAHTLHQRAAAIELYLLCDPGRNERCTRQDGGDNSHQDGKNWQSRRHLQSVCIS